MRDEVITVSPDNLMAAVAKLKMEGYRFVTLSCMQADESAFVILYHFDKDFALKHLRVHICAGNPLSSITPLYFAAFLAENEIQDLFGLRFNGLAIDYERTLYSDGEVKQTPFCKYTSTKMQRDEAKSPPVSAPACSTGGS